MFRRSLFAHLNRHPQRFLHIRYTSGAFDRSILHKMDNMNTNGTDTKNGEHIKNPGEDNKNGSKKREHPSQGRNGHGRGPKRQRMSKDKPIKEGSSEEVLLMDIKELLKTQPATTTSAPLPEPFSEIQVQVLEISSTGDGLAKAPESDQIYVVPFTLPGDTVLIKVIKHFKEHHYSLADFKKVINPSPLRNDSLVNCKYFASCSGCQFQMMPYADQLKHKRTIVERAYKHFSRLSPSVVPTVQDTMGSPLQYGYRTKLTPHFDGPPGYRSRELRKKGEKKSFEEVPFIGFQMKGQRKTLDIEDCPIGTDVVRLGMKRERAKVVAELDKYHKGATILLRESTMRYSSTDAIPTPLPEDSILTTNPTHTDLKTCITDSNATSTEYIDSYKFTNPAGSFFQNNNSILSPFTQYIRDHILPPTTSTSSDSPPIKYLIDAYSGSGLFTITLSHLFDASIGIDISAPSITYASQNASQNSIPASRASFMAADAAQLFASVTYPPDETVVVIDPSRKGCDENFLKQLCMFGPRRVVYVSCNVHTQARDVGILVDRDLRGWKGEKGGRWEIESLRGFDFFPQTGHVEGVAVLARVDEEVAEEEGKDAVPPKETVPQEEVSEVEVEINGEKAETLQPTEVL